MKKKIISLYVFFVLLLAGVLFSSCSNLTAEKDLLSSYQGLLESGKAGLFGKLINEKEIPVEGEVVRLGKVVWSEDRTSASFIIDGANSPSTISEEDGSFVFLNIDPGEYVIVVRNIDINPIVIPELPGSNTAAIYTTESDQMLDVNIIKINTNN
jgi:hypothetical protein